MSDRLNVRSLLRKHGLKPKKSWSQNFLVDLGVLQDIVAAAQIGPGDVVVELGAGLGALTALLAREADRVIAVERDRDMVRVLRSEFAGDERVELLEANAATLDWSGLCAGLDRPPVVVGNLPYHMASQIMFHLLDAGPALARWLLMIQREMAQRAAAGPGGRDYGVLSILLQMRAEVESVLTVAPDAFHPPPKVVSEVIRCTPLAAPRHAVVDEDLFRRLVRGAFSQRRKKLRNAIRSALGAALAPEAVDALLEAEAVDPGLRPEQLSIAAWVGLANALAGRGLDGGDQ